MKKFLIGLFAIFAMTGCGTDTVTKFLENNDTEEVKTYNGLRNAIVTYKPQVDAHGGLADVKIRVAKTGDVDTDGWIIIHYLDGKSYDVYTPKSKSDDDFIYVDEYVYIPANYSDEDVVHTIVTGFFLDGNPMRLGDITINQDWYDATENIVIDNTINIYDDEIINIEISDDENITIYNEIVIEDSNETNTTL